MQYHHSRQIVISGFAFVFIALLAAAISGITQFNALNKRQLEATEQFVAKLKLLNTMLYASRERAISLTLIVSIDDPVERDAQMMRFYTMGLEFAAARTAFQELPLTDTDREYLERQGTIVRSGIDRQHEVIHLSQTDRQGEAKQLLVSHALPTQQQNFGILQELYNIQTQLHQQLLDEHTMKHREGYFSTVILLAIFSALIALGTGALVLRHIRHTESALLDANERFDLAMRGSNDGLWDWNMRTGEVYYSPRWKQMLGYDEAELENHLGTWEQLIHPEDRPQAEQDMQEHIDGRSPCYENIQRMRGRNGSYQWQLERGMVVHDKEGRPCRVIGTNTDISKLKKVEEDLFQEKERAQVTLHSIGDAVITTDHHGLIAYMNPVAERITGWANVDARGMPIELVCKMENEQNSCPIDSILGKGFITDPQRELKCTSVLTGRLGRQYPVMATATPMKSREGKIIGSVIVIRDMTESREMSRKLNWQASHDMLTGLFNRSELEQRLADMLDETTRDHVEHAFLYLDLDQFKIINDTCGHSAGDELLRQLTKLIKNELRDIDTFARLGGDEFGILLSHCNISDAEHIAEKIRNVVKDYHFVWDARDFTIGVSIGIVAIDKFCNNVAAILSSADMACYAAKDLGRNRVHLFTPDDAELSRRHLEMEWVNRIQLAISEKRLILYRQTIKPIQTGTDLLPHSEILLRMVDEDGNVISPASFLPAAEKYNIMPQIDREVVRLCFEWISSNPDKNHPISINLSGCTLSDHDFLSHVKYLATLHHIDMRNICFEITETAAIANLSSAILLINELKKTGCEFSLDDFGSGLSSFSYLKSLPVDYLKIDGSFVRDLLDDNYDLAMVKAISSMGKVMHLKVIAEFVENDHILEQLRSIGIDYAQGYAIDRPVPLSLSEEKSHYPRHRALPQ